MLGCVEAIFRYLFPLSLAVSHNPGCIYERIKERLDDQIRLQNCRRECKEQRFAIDLAIISCS